MTPTLRPLHTLGALALLAALSTAPAHAATLGLSGPSVVQSGSNFALAVSATNAADLYAYQFDLQFDPLLFQATGVSQGSFLATAGTTFFDGGVIDNLSGTISFALESLIGPGPGASGQGLLLQVDFTAIAPSGSLGSFALANASAVDSSLADINLSLQGTTVAVPEPASALLALAALGMLGLRQRQAARAGQGRGSATA